MLLMSSETIALMPDAIVFDQFASTVALHCGVIIDFACILAFAPHYLYNLLAASTISGSGQGHCAVMDKRCVGG